MINTIPLRVDPSFHAWAKEMIKKDPTLNQRKITKNLAKKKLIIGELLFNPDFEKYMEDSYREMDDIYREQKKDNEKRFFL